MVRHHSGNPKFDRRFRPRPAQGLERDQPGWVAPTASCVSNDDFIDLRRVEPAVSQNSFNERGRNILNPPIAVQTSNAAIGRAPGSDDVAGPHRHIPDSTIPTQAIRDSRCVDSCDIVSTDIDRPMVAKY